MNKSPSSKRTKKNQDFELYFYKSGLWVLELRKSHDQLIDDLYAHASKGSRAHFFSLVRVAIKAIMQVRELTQTHLNIACDIAEHLEFWPTALNTHQPFILDGKELVKRLNLGAFIKIPFQIEEVFQTANTPRYIAALLINATSNLILYGQSRSTHRHLTRLLRLAEQSENEEYRTLAPSIKGQLSEVSTKQDENFEGVTKLLGQVTALLGVEVKLPKITVSKLARKAVHLPYLSVNSKGAWFEFGRELILSLTGGFPEKTATLRELGWYRRNADLQKRYPPGPELEKQKKITAGRAASETNIRDGAFTAIREAYGTVVKYLAEAERVTPPDFSPWLRHQKNGER
jgi:hypothetical protein